MKIKHVSNHHLYNTSIQLIIMHWFLEIELKKHFTFWSPVDPVKILGSHPCNPGPGQNSQAAPGSIFLSHVVQLYLDGKAKP